MKKLNKKGFTLVELLAVIVVLALLMVVAASSIGSALENSKKSALKTEAKKILNFVKNEFEVAKMLYPNDIIKGVNANPSTSSGIIEIRTPQSSGVENATNSYCYGYASDEKQNTIANCYQNNGIIYLPNGAGVREISGKESEAEPITIQIDNENLNIIFITDEKNNKEVKKNISKLYEIKGKDGNYNYEVLIDDKGNIIAFAINYKEEIAIKEFGDEQKLSSEINFIKDKNDQTLDFYNNEMINAYNAGKIPYIVAEEL